MNTSCDVEEANVEAGSENDFPFDLDNLAEQIMAWKS